MHLNTTQTDHNFSLSTVLNSFFYVTSVATSCICCVCLGGENVVRTFKNQTCSVCWLGVSHSIDYDLVSNHNPLFASGICHSRLRLNSITRIYRSMK